MMMRIIVLLVLLALSVESRDLGVRARAVETFSYKRYAAIQSSDHLGQDVNRAALKESRRISLRSRKQ